MSYQLSKKNMFFLCILCKQCFSCKNVLTGHKKVCLSINGAQSVRLEQVAIEFKNYFKQIPVPFKIYADFECKKLAPYNLNLHLVKYSYLSKLFKENADILI